MAKFEELNVQYSMRKILITFYFSFLTFDFFGQTITQKLQKAFTTFEKDSQLKHAISSLYVIDANTGQVVFDKNSQIGLAPASTQKLSPVLLLLNCWERIIGIRLNLDSNQIQPGRMKYL